MLDVRHWFGATGRRRCKCELHIGYKDKRLQDETFSEKMSKKVSAIEEVAREFESVEGDMVKKRFNGDNIV